MHGILQRGNSAELIRTQKLKIGIFDIGITLGGVMPAYIILIARIFRDSDVITLDLLAYQRLRIGLESSEMFERCGLWKFCDQNRIALFQVPEVMQVAVRKNDKPDVLRISILPRLFFADQGIVFLRLSFQYGNGEITFVQKKIIDESMSGFLKVVTEAVERFLLYLDVRFKSYVGRAGLFLKKPPPRSAQKIVD